MKRLALLLASAAFVTPALAADVIYDTPVAPAAPMEIAPVTETNTWTGLYIGGQAGVAFGQDSNDIRFDPENNGAFGETIFENDDTNAGFVGGGHIGYDYQFGNNLVVGAVADLNYIDAETSRSYSIDGNRFGVSEDLDYFGTVRGRLGYAMDSILVYGSGGLAYSGYNRDNSFPSVPTNSLAGYTFKEDGDDVDVGYSVGGGIDVMATRNISFGVEYLYTNLGKNDYSVEATNGSNTIDLTSTSKDDLDFHTIFAKASYRFN
ncbi:outer membrane beta-barrel protein [Aurantimonas sp. Leaf443]|uniref:outer membrane protein n=1 Tax=Aurantimonas sp. Leaf443 TaxID=1736378 RepID=UPI0006F91D88|nr:outer membrane beta-barrel protein [Aurantimonas sp. Leaf443]KQT85958.1 hypothetical protein ASG48_05020 [Aurantimonas sp. Leaf443]